MLDFPSSTLLAAATPAVLRRVRRDVAMEISRAGWVRFGCHIVHGLRAHIGEMDRCQRFGEEIEARGPFQSFECVNVQHRKTPAAGHLPRAKVRAAFR
jgi:hypothetical protein